ncbi:MAG: MFS transporter [Chloroflexi bacterium]|nr:MFS transporter [Anaerolineaceae bacterium]NMB87091.1 MFS transporter [Chloroflexota bacterium]
MLPGRFPALSNRNFRIFWFGQFVSLIGTWMQTTVQPYLAYRITDQPIYLGWVGFASALPAFFITLPGGVFVERIDKRKAVILMQTIMMGQAFILAFLTLTGQVTIWHIIILAAVSGMANAFELTARQAMIVELVGKDALPNAIALNSAIFNAARVVGPSLTAPFFLLLGESGEGWAFFANGVSYLFVIFSLMMIRTDPLLNTSTQAESMSFAGLVAGQRYVRQTPVIFLLIIMASIPSLFGFPFNQQIPVFARDVFHLVGDTESAVAARNSMMVTFQGLGALIAAIFLAAFSTIRKKGRLLIAGQLAFALGLIGISRVPIFQASLPMMILIGWGTVTQLASTNTIIQLTAPDHLRSRVLSTYLWSVNGLAPFGSLCLGWLVQTLGAQTAVMLGGTICLVGYAYVHLRRPMIRNLVI